MNIYGVITGKDSAHTDISLSLQGTKRYATINGYDTISVRYNGGYIAEKILKKVGKKWVKYLVDSE